MSIDDWEGSADPVIFHDGVKIIHLNPAACVLFKIEECQFDGVPLVLLIDPELRPLKIKRMEHLTRQSEQGTPLYEVEYPFYRMDGTRFWAKVDTKVDAEGGLIRTRLYHVFEDWE